MKTKAQDLTSVILAQIDEEQRELFLELPREERVGWLAEHWGEAESSILDKLAAQSGIRVVTAMNLPEDPRAGVPLRIINEYRCLPIAAPEGCDSEALHLVTVWPPDAVMDDWIMAACGREPCWYLGVPKKISETITQVFGVGSGSLEDQDMAGFEDSSDDEAEDEDAALIRFVNEVITKALADRATDIHFEPQRDMLQIRYRIDGELIPVRVPENLVQFQRAIISRLKIMAKLNIAERRRPQDVRIGFKIGNDPCQRSMGKASACASSATRRSQ